MATLRRVALFLWSLWTDAKWSHFQFTVAVAIVLVIFCGSLGFMACDNRASVVRAENAARSRK